MPIAQLPDGRLLYFAHVPKCGGSAVEDYLARRFGPLGLFDWSHLKRPPSERATISSPQHLTAMQIARLFPPGIFVASFAVVRHPVSRMVSEYAYDSKISGRAVALDERADFAAWLDEALDEVGRDPTVRDNHLRPQSDFVPQDARVFAFESGLAPIILWLDSMAGGADGPRDMTVQNPGPMPAESRVARLVGPRQRALIAQRFAVDFERFGYDPEHCAAAPPRSPEQGGVALFLRRFALLTLRPRHRR
jgi:hypothetical protein